MYIKICIKPINTVDAKVIFIQLCKYKNNDNDNKRKTYRKISIRSLLEFNSIFLRQICLTQVFILL